MRAKRAPTVEVPPPDDADSVSEVATIMARGVVRWHRARQIPATDRSAALPIFDASPLSVASTRGLGPRDDGDDR